MRLLKHHRDEFADWLTSCGAEVLEPVEPGEIFRVVVKGKSLIAKQIGSVQSWPAPLQKLYSLHRGRKIYPALAEAGKTRRMTSTRKARVMRLGNRDGWECWFCGVGLQALDQPINPRLTQASIEEICPRQIGGPTHISNQVLACLSCNQIADNLPVVEKVAMRDRLRQSPSGGLAEAQPPDEVTAMEMPCNIAETV